MPADPAEHAARVGHHLKGTATMTESTDLAVPATLSDAERTIERLSQGRSSVWSSIPADTFEGKKEVMNATLNAEPLADHIGETINLRHLVVQEVEIVDSATGEATNVLRTVLVTEDGTAFYALSDGLQRSLDTLLGLMGHPSMWDGPIAIVVEKVKGKRGSYYSLRMA